jgi:hypothetical protein
MKGTTTAAAGLAMLVGLSIGIGSVAAHHSGSMFDHSKLMTIKGMVTEFRWVNPHASVSVNGTVDGRGQPELWVFEMGSPGTLVRTGGWAHDAVKVGDRVEVTFNPLYEIEHQGGALRTLTLIDTGKKLTNYQIDLNQERPGLQ